MYVYGVEEKGKEHARGQGAVLVATADPKAHKITCSSNSILRERSIAYNNSLR